MTSHFDAAWLLVCLGAELIGYVGYVLALRNIARVDGGPKLSFALTARTVVSGFGVYPAAHAAGGFAIDFMALRKAGLKRERGNRACRGPRGGRVRGARSGRARLLRWSSSSTRTAAWTTR